MKLTFKLNTLVSALIIAEALTPKAQLEKIEQACESYRNDMQVMDTKQDRKLRIVGGKDNRAAEDKETLKITRRGEDNVVARFIAYNDEVRVLSERAAKSEAVIVLKTVPAEFHAWLGKFGKTKAEKAPAKNGNGATPATPARSVTPAAVSA